MCLINLKNKIIQILIRLNKLIKYCGMEEYKNKPLVSIVVPCYNHEMYLYDCLESVRKQSYKKIELIIIDDCSQDSSWEIIQSYVIKFKNSMYAIEAKRNETNLGITKTLNSLLKLAHGNLIKPLASDDYLDADCISSFVHESINNENINIFISNGYNVYEDSSYYKNKIINNHYSSAPNFNDGNLFERIYLENFIFSPGVVIIKKVYDDYGYYDENSGIEDLDFFLKVTSNGNTIIKYIDKKLVFYRIHENSASSSINFKKNIEKNKKYYFKRIQIAEKYRLRAGEELYSRKIINLIYGEFLLSLKNRIEIENYYFVDDLDKIEIKNIKDYKTMIKYCILKILYIIKR